MFEVPKRGLLSFRRQRLSTTGSREKKALGSVAGERCWRPPVTGRQIIVFLLRRLCPCRRR